MKTISLLTILAAPLLFSNCRETKQKIAEAKEEVATAGDVTFAKNTFESLAKGDSAVADKIDWAVFTPLGENLGAAYVALNSAVEKQKLVSGFITQFSVSFRESGGSVDAFTNWRVTAHDSQKTEVAADSTTGVLTIIVSERDGVEKVSSINMIK
ncbi:MAG: hypothetical protein V4584_11765 [Verrucomicrobiota bacterium]